MNKSVKYTKKVIQGINELLRPPEAPARNTDRHQDVHYHLDEEDEEEHKEVEGTITPVETERDPAIILNILQEIYNNTFYMLQNTKPSTLPSWTLVLLTVGANTA